MKQLRFTTTPCWRDEAGFGCASLGLAGVCANDTDAEVIHPLALEGCVFTGTYEQVLTEITTCDLNVHAAIVLFGNAGKENRFIRQFQSLFCCPVVGGGAAIDGATGKSALITGGGEVAVFLITDDRYTYVAQTQCIHDQILEECTLTLQDPRTLLTINGEDAAQFLDRYRKLLGLRDSDFEHLTLSDRDHINAHLSYADGLIKSGRDLDTTMLLRYVAHESVFAAMRTFYDDPNAIVFGCAGLSGLLDRPLDTKSLGLFLFGEVCTVNGKSEFGNLMLSKLRILPK